MINASGCDGSLFNRWLNQVRLIAIIRRITQGERFGLEMAYMANFLLQTHLRLCVSASRRRRAQAAMWRLDRLPG
ncbi:hypothetical protein D3C80_1493700 [compost metagenome]